MVQKYIIGQKVKIIEVKNEHGHQKYPELQEQANETAKVIESYFIPIRGLEGTSLEGEILDLYLYKVELDKDSTILEVAEDALVALDE